MRSAPTAYLAALLLLSASLSAVSVIVPQFRVAGLNPTFVAIALFGVVTGLFAGLARGSASATRSRWPSGDDLVRCSPGFAIAAASGLAPDPPIVLSLGGIVLAAFARRDPFLTPSDGAHRITFDLFSSSLYGLAALTSVSYVAISRNMVGPRCGDDEYYFGVARWMATHHAFEEPIVWHLMAPPEHVVHAPFDHWQGLTSLVLVPPFLAFGPTYEVANATMTGLSIVSVFAFTFLVTTAAPLRSRALQLAAVLAFSWSPEMLIFRFHTESPLMCQVCLIGALIAAAFHRLPLAAVVAFLAVFSRSDCIVPAGIIWIYLALRSSSAEFDRRSRRLLAAAMFGCVLAFVGSNLARFGTPTPPGARIATGLATWGAMYEYLPERVAPSLAELVADRTTWYHIRRTSLLLVATFRERPYVVEPALLLVGIAVGSLLWTLRCRSRHSLLGLSLAMVVAGSFGIASGAPGLFFAFRALHSLIPSMHLLVFSSADSVVQVLQEWTWRRPWIGRSLHGGMAALVLLATIPRLRLYEPLAPVGLALSDEIRQLSPLLHGEVVATDVPWLMMANTDSPSFLFPFQDDEVKDLFLERYHPAFLLLSRGPNPDFPIESWAGWSDFASGARTQVGRFRFEHLRTTTHFVVYRVVDAQ